MRVFISTAVMLYHACLPATVCYYIRLTTHYLPCVLAATPTCVQNQIRLIFVKLFVKKVSLRSGGKSKFSDRLKASHMG